MLWRFWYFEVTWQKYWSSIPGNIILVLWIHFESPNSNLYRCRSIETAFQYSFYNFTISINFIKFGPRAIAWKLVLLYVSFMRVAGLMKYAYFFKKVHSAIGSIFEWCLVLVSCAKEFKSINESQACTVRDAVICEGNRNKRCHMRNVTTLCIYKCFYVCV